jgi:predicted nucleotidyltransferase
MTEPTLAVAPRELTIVQDILRKWVPHYEVWAFGSRVKGKSWRFSDLDLAVISDKPMGFSLIGDIKDDFSESDLPFRVDVVDWAATSDSFRQIIEERKIVVQPKPAP